MRNGPECLQLHSLVGGLRRLFSEIPDWRTPKRVEYSVVDSLMGGLAMMFWQDPGVLPFQQRMQERTGASNLSTLFSVSRVPSDTQIRDLTDPIGPEWLLKGLRCLVTLAQRTRAWREFHVLDGRVLVVIDGTEFFHSDKIKCSHCLVRHHRDGQVEYYHQVLVAAMIQPKTGRILPLCAEEIRLEDGKTKQDCETNAAYRLLPKLAKMYCHLDIVLVADSLYSKSPLMDLVLSLKMNYIFVAQPGDHPHLQTELKGLRLSGGVVTVEKKDKDNDMIRLYEFAHEVPLFASKDTLCNWVAFSETKSGGKKGYRNGWVTNLKPGKQNIGELAWVGRQRSKIENETFNALKNHGYNFEHNFGHGTVNLRFNFLLLNLLAFMMHQLLGIGDKLYQEALSWKGAVKNFIDHIRWAIRFVLWPSWETLLNHFLDRGPKLRLDSG